MKSKKRILTLTLALAMVVGTLGACSNDGGNSGAPASGSTASTYTQAAADKAPTLIWWTVGNATGDKRPETFEKINAYTAETIGVKMDLKVAGWNDFGTKMNTIVNSGEYFDIMFTNGNDYNRYANYGAFADITADVPAAIPELQKFIPEMVWTGTKVNNKIYAVPTYKDSAMGQYWVWDKAMAIKYDLDPAKLLTVQDLDPALRKVKEGEGKTFYPFTLDQGGLNGWGIGYDGMGVDAIGMGVSMKDSAHKVVSIMEQDDIMGMLRTMHGWYKDGIINPDAPTLSEMPKYRMLGSVQTFPGQEASSAEVMGLKQTETTGVQLVCYGGPFYSTSSIQGSLNAVGAKSKYKIEALKYLEMLNMDHKLRDMYCYGDEGVHYNRISDYVVKTIEGVDWGLAAYTQATFATRSLTEGTPADQWKQIQKQNDVATASPLLGFMMDISKLNDEVANCRAIWEKYNKELLTGASDPDVIVPKMVAEWKAVGWDKIMTEAQAQIDAHFKG